MKTTDLNCDLGEWKNSESRKYDEQIMPFISSCNIACGGHIGDEDSVKRTLELAINNEVAVGVHPSYPDRNNFGRVVPDISYDQLSDSLHEQLCFFKKMIAVAGTELHHIKPHGALYNHMSNDPVTVDVVLKVMNEVFPGTMVYLASGSNAMKSAVSKGIPVIAEVFADRVYEEDLSLRSRDLNDAMLTEAEDVISQIRHFILSDSVLTHSGAVKSIKADSICLHSDTPGASKLAKAINKFLKEHGITITAP